MILNEKAGDLMGADNQKQLERQETLEAIRKLNLLNDNLMTLVFDRNIEATELLLNVILQRNDLKVLEVVAQREYKNPMPGGRSITIDIYAKDGKDKVYDIEVQRVSAGAGCSLHHIDRVIKETGAYFGDGSHIIYVNGSYKDDSDPIGKLMHDFRCLSSVDMFYPALAKQVRYFKETEGGQDIMCQVFDDLAEKRAEKRAEEARIEEKKAFARRLIARGKQTVEEIAEDADLPIEVVRELAGLQLV